MTDSIVESWFAVLGIIDSILGLICLFFFFFKETSPTEGFPCGSVVKNPPANAGHLGLISGLGRSPEKAVATHSSILAWEIPWTEESGGLQSMGSQRVGHNLVTKQQ